MDGVFLTARLKMQNRCECSASPKNGTAGEHGKVLSAEPKGMFVRFQSRLILNRIPVSLSDPINVLSEAPHFPVGSGSLSHESRIIVKP
jgi:hypothetical protein